MYYESKNEKKKDKIIMFVFMVVIISLLCILIIKLDEQEYNQTVTSSYDVEKLSTNSEQTVENKEPKKINEVVKI